ncbi:MAG TPA: acyltransferase family protein [Coleofasciculaceae cyanobacterium]|jgi:peptidoglycan/LPS O-acetylase OafA/YrhL
MPEARSPFILLQLLDFCKGVAIILVVLVHFQGGWGWQGVHPFIVLSGFGLAYSCAIRSQKYDWKVWYVKRIRKILPAYWLTCLLGYCLMVGVYLSNGETLLNSLSLPKQQLFFDLLLLGNFHNGTIITLPNFSLWFVPFIISIYLVFPPLYQLMAHAKSRKELLTVLLRIIGLEFVYRAVVIWFLDGSPIGYRNFEWAFPDLGVPFNHLPDTTLFFFQGEAPFGFFPARIGEFALGMAIAIVLIKTPRMQRNLLSRWASLAGIFIWVSGNALLYSGFLGWVFADFWIALGLTLYLVNLAVWMQKRLPILFSGISYLGVWSYYIFLTHFLFIYLLFYYLPDHTGFDLLQIHSAWKLTLVNLGFFVLIILGTAVSSHLLKWFDRSRFADWTIEYTVAKVLK